MSAIRAYRGRYERDCQESVGLPAGADITYKSDDGDVEIIVLEAVADVEFTRYIPAFGEPPEPHTNIEIVPETLDVVCHIEVKGCGYGVDINYEMNQVRKHVEKELRGNLEK